VSAYPPEFSTIVDKSLDANPVEKDIEFLITPNMTRTLGCEKRPIHMGFDRLLEFFRRVVGRKTDLHSGLEPARHRGAATQSIMQISFRFNLEKAVQAMSFFVERLGPTDKVKLMKLVYLADKDHFVRHGFPITGDRQYAMQHGPVPSSTLNALNGDIQQPHDRVFKFLHVNDNKVELRQTAGQDLLTPGEIETLRRVADVHGGKATWALVRETHRLPEYKDCFVADTSRPIPYEDIAKHSGVDARYRSDRPVISSAMLEQMICPLSPASDL
jgi:uncharacterized phage-associated protein